MVCPVLGGSGGGFFTWITLLNPAWTFFGVLGGIALGLFISNEIAARRIYKRGISIPTQKPLSNSERKYADWMTTSFNRDINILSSCIFVHDIEINWLPLRETDSFFVISYKVYSSSVFRLEIGKSVEGHLRYGSEPMERVPEIYVPIEQLERSATQPLALRQWVSQSRMNQIAKDGGNEVNLIFSDVNIWVQAKYPDGSDGPKCRLPITDKKKVRIPTRVALETQ
ncbi:hypothetical protein ACFLXT_03835 [Chloroflexota bacterium]